MLTFEQDWQPIVYNFQGCLMKTHLEKIELSHTSHTTDGYILVQHPLIFLEAVTWGMFWGSLQDLCSLWNLQLSAVFLKYNQSRLEEYTHFESNLKLPKIFMSSIACIRQTVSGFTVSGELSSDINLGSCLILPTRSSLRSISFLSHYIYLKHNWT